MFDKAIYKERREILKKKLNGGICYFPGNNESSMNYPSNTYLYRQDSSFLYYFGLDRPGLAAVIDLDSGDDILFGDDRSIDDVVWMGDEMPLAEQAAQVGIGKTMPLSDLDNILKSAVRNSRKVHFLPLYRPETKLLFENQFGIRAEAVNDYVSWHLVKAVIEQRSIKSPEEIKEMEYAVGISYEMNTTAMRLCKPGIYERDVAGTVEGIALAKGCGVSFPIIFSVHGETLHNHYHGNLMKDGDIAVLDSGAESLLHYASDITRTIPVSGTFTAKQKEIYNIVLSSQLKAIEAIKPGIKYKDVHLLSCKVIAEGLKELGIMKGDVDEAVKAGAHALFMPHGLGHMIGIDVHDMEGLREDLVGYDKETQRSDQFGLAFLRLGRELQQGFALTVEPGIYFIPKLIDLWKNDKKHSNFINYDKVEEYRGFGGIRIEDDVLVTENGYKVLGDKPIPKSVEDVEETCNS